MATDFAPYANFRFLWRPPGEVDDFRSGVPMAGTPILIEAFLKGETGTATSLPSVKDAPRILTGYITATAAVTGNVSWLAARSAFSWNATGMAPVGLLPGVKGHGLLGSLEALPATAGAQSGSVTVISVGGAFGVGGIGAELRAALGDALQVSFEVPA